MSARRWLPPAIWAALILVLTSIPNPNVGDVGIPAADKLFHGALYLVLGWLAARATAVAPGSSRGPLQVGVLLIAVALFAAGDEWHQRWIPGRSPELRDWAADLFGALLGVAAARFRVLRREPVT
ncbi:MAG TPA: VanZ family protein [Gemmatimonadaceae bacterium]|nr:VanZ family protein [Gemmatimonadaceae bacterium]